MQIKYPNVKSPPNIQLGFVCDAKKTFMKDRDFKIIVWGKKVRARSYSIISEQFEKYGTGLMGSVTVAYFTRKDEGQHQLQ